MSTLPENSRCPRRFRPPKKVDASGKLKVPGGFGPKKGRRFRKTQAAAAEPECADVRQTQGRLHL
eukprot:5638876-Prymnesium_polylepis.1